MAAEKSELHEACRNVCQEIVVLLSGVVMAAAHLLCNPKIDAGALGEILDRTARAIRKARDV